MIQIFAGIFIQQVDYFRYCERRSYINTGTSDYCPGVARVSGHVRTVIN